MKQGKVRSFISKVAFLKDILPMLSKRVSDIVKAGCSVLNDERLEEVRLRADKPLMLQNNYREWFVGRDGSLQGSPEGSYIVKQEDIKAITGIDE